MKRKAFLVLGLVLALGAVGVLPSAPPAAAQTCLGCRDQWAACRQECGSALNTCLVCDSTNPCDGFCQCCN